MIPVVPHMVIIFMPSSRVVSPSWNQGASANLGMSMQISTTANVMDQGITLVFTHVP